MPILYWLAGILIYSFLFPFSLSLPLPYLKHKNNAEEINSVYAVHGKYGVSLQKISHLWSENWVNSPLHSGLIFFHHFEWALKMASEYVYWEKQEQLMPQALPKAPCRLLLRRWFRDKFHRSKESAEIHEDPALRSMTTQELPVEYYYYDYPSF